MPLTTATTTGDPTTDFARTLAVLAKRDGAAAFAQLLGAVEDVTAGLRARIDALERQQAPALPRPDVKAAASRLAASWQRQSGK